MRNLVECFFEVQENYDYRTYLFNKPYDKLLEFNTLTATFCVDIILTEIFTTAIGYLLTC